MIDEPLFRSQIPERASDAFSRQWYAAGGWKLDEPTIMMKVDRTKKKMGDLIRRVTVLGSENVIPEWLYSSLFEYIQWIMSSTGVHKISMDMVRDSSSGFDAIRYVDKTEKIYPKIPVKISLPKIEDWDPLVFGNADTKDIVAITDGVAGRVGEEAAGMCSIDTLMLSVCQ